MSIDDISIEIEDEQLTSEDIMIKNEIEEIVRKALLTLPKKTLIVYRMIKEEHMSYKQVSEILNISERTINTHMTNAIHKLTSTLIKYFNK